MLQATPGRELFIIEGKITDFPMRLGRVNLLKKLNVGSTKQNLTAGLAGAAGDNPALAANAAILQSYEGESAAYFGCHLGPHIVIGQFSGAHLLNDGDDVKAVVSTQGNVLYAHAIVRPKDGILWLPVGQEAGRWGRVRSEMRLVAFTFLAINILAFIVGSFLGSGFNVYSVVLLVSFIMFIAMALWSYHDFKPLALEAERIFKVLGFPHPARLDMNRGAYIPSTIATTTKTNDPSITTKPC